MITNDNNKIILIKGCKMCPFAFKSMDGWECTHPDMLALGAYMNMIIRHDGVVPDRCPLRKGPQVFTITVDTALLKS